MRRLTVEQKKFLEELNLEEFKQLCVEDLESLKLKEKGYPTNLEKYPAFVEECCDRAALYGLESEKEIKALIMAAHVAGRSFTDNEEQAQFLLNKNNSNTKKFELLMSIIKENE